MHFDYSSKRYHWGSKHGAYQQKQVKGILTYSVQHRRTITQTYNYLMSMGLGYRKTNMLEDISRSFAIEYSGSKGAQKRADTWFGEIDAIRKEYGMKHRSDAIEMWDRWKDGVFYTDAEIKSRQKVYDRMGVEVGDT